MTKKIESLIEKYRDDVYDRLNFAQYMDETMYSLALEIIKKRKEKEKFLKNQVKIIVDFVKQKAKRIYLNTHGKNYKKGADLKYIIIYILNNDIPKMCKLVHRDYDLHDVSLIEINKSNGSEPDIGIKVILCAKDYIQTIIGERYIDINRKTSFIFNACKWR